LLEVLLKCFYRSAVAAGRVLLGAPELDHDVEVVGWEEEADGMVYWLVCNRFEGFSQNVSTTMTVSCCLCV
jgi:hypothetical protein